jgi:hypothetical protein
MDPELERLVADMSVMRTPPRRDEGGLGNVRGNEPGSLDEDSTVTGQPFTVFSHGVEGVGVPRVVNLDNEHVEILIANQANNNGKHVKIFVVPGWDDGFSTYCFQFIGQGASFCTAKNCTTSHHHASKKEVVPGKLYVCKSSTTAFVTPSITSSVIDCEVLIQWRGLSLSLHEWNEKFFIATNASDEAPASTAAMEVQEAFFRTKALNFKTPAKRKRLQEEGDSIGSSLLDVSTYAPFFKDDKEAAPITELGQVSGILARLDQGVTTNNKALINLITDYRQEHLKAGDALLSMWLRIEALTSSLGTIPIRLAFDYLAPSAWASIGAMAAKVDSLSKLITGQSTRLDGYKNEVKTSVEQQVRTVGEGFYTRLEDFKIAFIQAIRGLGNRLDNLELRLIGIGDAPVPLVQQLQPVRRAQETIVIGDDTAFEAVTRVEIQVDEMERKLRGLLAKNEEQAIRFAGLGFQTISESNAWLEMAMQRHQSGLIVDAHMVFEYVFHAIEGIDTMATMEKLYKIKVSCIADSVAMTSFDAKTPKYFSRVQGHRVLKLDASYFDTIVSHSDWADIGTGFKMRLQEALAEFQESHACFIDQAVELGLQYTGNYISSF